MTCMFQFDCVTSKKVFVQFVLRCYTCCSVPFKSHFPCKSTRSTWPGSIGVATMRLFEPNWRWTRQAWPCSWPCGPPIPVCRRCWRQPSRRSVPCSVQGMGHYCAVCLKRWLTQEIFSVLKPYEATFLPCFGWGWDRVGMQDMRLSSVLNG